MTASIEVTKGSELPDWIFEWKDRSGNIIDFSTGWTFTLTIGTPTPIVKNTGITGAATSPNITATFAAGELDSLPATTSVVSARLDARRTVDSKDREPLRFTVRVLAP